MTLANVTLVDNYATTGGGVRVPARRDGPCLQLPLHRQSGTRVRRRGLLRVDHVDRASDPRQLRVHRQLRISRRWDRPRKRGFGARTRQPQPVRQLGQQRGWRNLHQHRHAPHHRELDSLGQHGPQPTDRCLGEPARGQLQHRGGRLGGRHARSSPRTRPSPMPSFGSTSTPRRSTPATAPRSPWMAPTSTRTTGTTR